FRTRRLRSEGRPFVFARPCREVRNRVSQPSANSPRGVSRKLLSAASFNTIQKNTRANSSSRAACATRKASGQSPEPQSRLWLSLRVGDRHLPLTVTTRQVDVPV